MKRARTTKSSKMSTQKKSQSDESPSEAAPSNVEKFRVQNTTVKDNLEKMYLNAETADVFFIFNADTEHAERVPAHKDVLVAKSPVFKAMLSESTEDQKDGIRIADATADDFKKFLQFFYLTEFELTSDNIGKVMDLCKKYEFTEGLKVCDKTLVKSLSIENMFRWYGIAERFELHGVTGWCEETMECEAEECCFSASLPECDREVFGSVLDYLMEPMGKFDLVSERAPQVVDACMDWAKAECKRNGLEATPINLKAQLEEFMGSIPFEQIGSWSFKRFYEKYKGFFDTDDLVAIIMELFDTDSHDHYKRRKW